MRSFSTFGFIFKRLGSDWKLLLSIFAGVIIASTLVAGAPVYLNSLARLTLNTSIDRSSILFLNIFAFAPNVPLSEESLNVTDGEIDRLIEENIADFYVSRERFLKGSTLLVGTPRRPLANADADLVSRGYLQYLSNVEQNVEFVSGRAFTDTVTQTEDRFHVEVLIGTTPANVFSLKVGDKLELKPSLGTDVSIIAEIVGLIDPTDPSADYWQQNANVFMQPAPLEEIPDVGIEVDPEEPPIALFVTRQALLDSLGKAYPGSLVSSSWFIFIDKEPLKKIRPEELRVRLDNLENGMAVQMQGSAVFSGITSLLDRFERRSFFTSIPLLLLLTIMVITVLYYMAMMVSYLVQSREDDVALLRSRGVSMAQLVRLYAIEGLVITAVAVIVAPLLAMGVIAISGKLPYFTEITGGALLPVNWRWMPFLVSAAVGALGLAIFVIPSVIGARTGLIIHKLRSSRPPEVPFFQRYYLDVMVLAIGGLVFWELNARGRLVSGGLFSGIEINEALLFAPVLLLTLVALVFMRFFPLFVRFISGESPTLVHLYVWVITAALTVTLLLDAMRQGDFAGAILPIGLALAAAVAYWATQRSERGRAKIYGVAAQIVLISGLIYLYPPTEGALAFLPSMGFVAIVPLQLIFWGLVLLSHRAPVWVSLSLWHMARNPLQYSWLVLLLVMVTGLAVLATTVGGTLNRSYQERILYDVGTDMRVSNIPGYIARSVGGLKERYLTIPGVTTVSMAFRGRGTLGANYTGSTFRVLAVEADDFQYHTWYRDDFSRNSLPEVMRALNPLSVNDPYLLPDDAEAIGIWVKPEDQYPNMYMWLVVQDADGVLDTRSLGNMGPPEWHLRTLELPHRLKRPLQLVSIQIFEPVFGPAGTAGSILLDNVHAIGRNGEIHALENFEDNKSSWLPLATSTLSSDSLALTNGDVAEGSQAGLFTFGKDTDNGLRGIYRSPSGGPVPVVASNSFLRTSGARVGDALIVELKGRFVPIHVRDSVDFFPTLDPRGAGFLLADLETLIHHINILSPALVATPNEMFIRKAPGAGNSVSAVVSRLVGRDLVHDREAQLEQVRLDPLITAGWQAMVLLAMAIILFTAGLGYVTYLLAFSNRSRNEMGFLQSIGLSSRQLAGLLILEHSIIIAVGIGLGSGAGWLMSDLMVSSVAVTENGREVIPPFILETDFRVLVPMYFALIAIFALAVYRLTQSMRHLDFHAISRME